MGNFISKINSSILNVSNAYHGLTPDVSTFNVSISHTDSTYFTTSVIGLPSDVMLKSVDGSNYSEKGHTHDIQISGATSQGGSVVPSGTINKPGITAGNTVDTFSYISDCTGSVTSTATTSGNVLSTWSYDSANEALTFTKSNFSFTASPTSASKNVLTNTSPSFSSGFTFTGNALTGHNHTYTVAGFTDIDQTAGSVTLVDLGLPSGKLWADRNVGATCEDTSISWFGNYYAWGEIVDKRDDPEGYSDTNYAHWDEDGNITKYNTDESYGTVDNKTVLEPEDDVATIEQGLRMPTQAEFQELCDYTNRAWQTNYNNVSGLNGYTFTNKSDSTKFIFIPAAGCYDYSDFYDAGDCGYLWSASLYSDYPDCAFFLGFVSDCVIPNYSSDRCSGFSVRGIQNPR